MSTSPAPTETANSRPSTSANRHDSSSEPNRKTRRKRARETRDAAVAGSPRATPAENAEAGPSKPSGAGTTGFGQEDFIAFTFSDAEGASEVEQANGARIDTSTRESGKGKEREVESAGRKRKVDEIDYNDGYSNKKERMNANSRLAPWATDIDWENCRNVAEMLHQEVDAFVKYMSPSPVEDEVRSLIVKAITNAVTKTYPDARVLPFGSYQTKLYLPLGDIDLVIESQSMAFSGTSAVLQSLANTMKRAGITDKVTIIAKAKVPIIKFITRHGRFSVDISINQSNGVKAGQMINRFLKELPALRGLVLITKAFLSQRNMNEVYTGGLGSYSIVCLAISFLQQHPKIRRGEIDPSKNLGVLMMDFFDLYGNFFRYNEVGISVRDGGSYYKKQQRGWYDYKAPGLLSIEDPGDPSNDISKGSFAIARVRTSLAGAFSMLTTAAYQRTEHISARRGRRYYSLQSSSDSQPSSILATVMGVTPETINHRRLVLEVYESRVLHRMVGVEPKAPLSTARPASPRPQPKDKARPQPKDKDRPPPKDKARPPPKDTARSREAEAATRIARKEASVEVESGEELEEVQHVTYKDEEDESRYDIRDKRQPAKKRRRTGTRKDAHTVYTSDEDEDEGPETAERSTRMIVHANFDDPNASGSEHSDSVAAEEEAYTETREKTTMAEQKRSYWLSKGVVAT